MTLALFCGVGDSAMALFDDGGYEDAFSSRCFSESDFEETCFERSFDLSSREELLRGYEIPDAAVHHFSNPEEFEEDMHGGERLDTLLGGRPC